MKMLDTLKYIMTFEGDDTTKEESLRKFFKVYCKLPQDFRSAFDFAVRRVTEGNSNTEVTVGWMILHILDEEYNDMIIDEINPGLIREISDNPNYNNRKETVLFLVWCFKQKQDEDMDIELEKVSFNLICLSTTCDVDVLLEVINLMKMHPSSIPRNFDGLNLMCEGLVMCLAMLPMPEPVPGVLKTFFEKVNEVQKFLHHAIYEVRSDFSMNLTANSLRLLYAAISNSEYFEHCRMIMRIDSKRINVSPTLAAVLPLVGVHLAELAVTGMVIPGLQTTDVRRALSTLCTWLLNASRWPDVSAWVLHFFFGLEKVGHYTLLTDIAEEFIDKLFVALKLPALRNTVAHVVFYMLVACQTPSVFHKTVPSIRETLYQLQRENSESSKCCLQVIINMVVTLMERFPGYEELYTPLLKAIEEFPSYKPGLLDLTIPPFALSNNPCWKMGPQDLKLLETIETKLHWRGLNNLGNTCYMNSVIQALFMTRRFCSAVLENKYSNLQPVFWKLQTLFSLLIYSPRPVLSPNDFYSVSRPAHFIPGQQQDSSEFLTYLLDVLEGEETPPTAKSVPLPAEHKQADNSQETAMEAEPAITRWTTEEDLSDCKILERRSRSLADFCNDGSEDSQSQQLSDHHSGSADSGIQSVGGDESPSPRSVTRNIIRTCFGGRMQTAYQCLDCNSESVHSDPIIDIQLSFPEGNEADKEHSVQDLLDFYLSPEKLCGDNCYSCERCGELKIAQKTLKVLEPPSHLILTLKHFHYDPANNSRVKLSHRVKYTEHVELPVIDKSRETYKLYAAVLHSGKDLDFGHYHSFARDSSDTWYVFDDTSVTASSLKNLSSWKPCGTPYILFYARPQEQLQLEPGRFPPQSTLNLQLQETLACDTLSYIHEKKLEDEKNRKRQVEAVIGSNLYQQNNDNDDNPPSGCGDSMSFNADASRFIY